MLQHFATKICSFTHFKVAQYSLLEVLKIDKLGLIFEEMMCPRD